MNMLARFIYFLFAIATSMIGYTIHHSIFWSVTDFIFTLITWTKWLIYHEVTMSIIKQTFNWFLA